MKILVVEDDPVTRLLLSRTCHEWGFTLIEAESAEDAMELLKRPEYADIHILLTDWSLPNMSGVSLCQLLKSSMPNHLLYVVMLTNKSSTESLVEAMDKGVDDFISKPFEAEVLRVRLRAGFRIVEQSLKLEFLANHDELTELWNRRKLIQELEKEWQRFKRSNEKLSLLLMDIDHFKRINDTYGHLAGDAALKHFANLLKKQCRPYDIPGRYGGEEFILALPETDLDQATLVGNRLREQLAQHPLKFEEYQIDLTVSIGVAEVAQDCSELQELITRADNAMYKAKRNGRDRVEAG